MTADPEQKYLVWPFLMAYRLTIALILLASCMAAFAHKYGKYDAQTEVVAMRRALIAEADEVVDRRDEIAVLRHEVIDTRAYSAYPFSQLLPMAEQCLRDAEQQQVTSWLCIGRYDRDDDGDVDADDLEAIRQAAAERWEGWRRRMVADPEEAERMRVVMDRVVEAMRKGE